MEIELKSLLLGVLLSTSIILGISEFDFVTKANADTISKQCVWSYIKDGGSPNIGEDGEVELTDAWLKMSKEGWVLKATGFNGVIYMFEKCN